MVQPKVRQLPWTPAAIEALQPSVLASPFPFEGAADVLTGAMLFEFGQEGQRALVAVRKVVLERGARLDVVGLVSLGDRVSACALSDAVERIAVQHGASAVTMCTKKDHVSTSCERAGWHQTGVIMSKGVGHVV